MKCLVPLSVQCLVCLLGLLASSDAFISPNFGCCTTRIQDLPGRMSISNAKPFDASSSSFHIRLPTVLSNGAAEPLNNDGENISKIYNLVGILSAMAWIATAFVALSYHPDPKFADCTMRHNVLTMSQAFAFPVPIAWACFEVLRKSAKSDSLDSNISRRLNLGIAVSSSWLAASSIFPTMFAFGYDLYSLNHKVIAAIIHSATGIFAFRMATKSTSIGQIIRGTMDSLWNLGPAPGHRNSSLYSTGAVGLLFFVIQPIVAPFPLATIPTILGKRLSRPASAFTLLGSIVAYCLKEKGPEATSKIFDSEKNQGEIRTVLRNGLAWGTSGHLFLIFLKLIGVDGGGLIFPGRGLWEVYPAMLSVPFAAGVSMAIHALLCFAAWTDGNTIEKLGD